jgi:hypothetical protein
MIPTAFDWLENVSALSTIVLYPTEVGWLPGALVLAKKCKLASLLVSNGAMVVAVAMAAGAWVLRRLRR